MWRRPRKERERTRSTCRKPTPSTSSRHGGQLCFLLCDAAPSVSLRPRINAPVILYYHSCFQASWKCLGGGHPCRARHLVETLQWVWAAQNIPPGHLPLHHRPSTTGEKGKERTYGRENTQAFQLQEFWLVDMIGILLQPSASVAA